MSVYYKFKSAKDYDSVQIDGHFISLGQLKEKIYRIKHLGSGRDFDILVTNAQTNEEYLDEGLLIPKNTSVLIRRVPGLPRQTIVTAPVIELEESIVENNSSEVQDVKGSSAGVETATTKYEDDMEWDEFGDDLFVIPATVPVQSSIPVQDTAPVTKENVDEDSMIKAFIDTPALDWQCPPSDDFGPGRDFGRGISGRMTSGRCFGRGGFKTRTPPSGYICHRCKVVGHFIQHCPTNGDPTFDIIKVKPATGIPNEAAFEKEIEGIPSTRSIGDLPPELHCPVCKEVMKDAVLTSKCCFTSFCDKCIRDYVISKSMCVCGATNIVADDLLPNKTLRDTINRILESSESSAEKGGSAVQQAKVLSPAHSAASKGHQVPAKPSQGEETFKAEEGVEENKATNAFPKQENGNVPEVLEATYDSRNSKEAALQENAQLADETMQQKPISEEKGKKKKKKKKIGMPPNAAEIQWSTPENYMMHPLGPTVFNPYWNGMAPGLDSFMPPYPCSMPYTSGYGPMDVPFPGFIPHAPFGGMGGMFPYVPPHRELSTDQDYGKETNFGGKMFKDQNYGRNVCVQREFSEDRDYYRRKESSKDGVSSMKSKDKSISLALDAEHHQQSDRRPSLDNRSCDPELARRSSNRKSDYNNHSPQDLRHQIRRNHHDEENHHNHHCRNNGSHQSHSKSPSETDEREKTSVFSRISYPDKEKKRKPVSNGHYEEHKAILGIKRNGATTLDDNSSDDERHFKRRRTSKYT